MRPIISRNRGSGRGLLLAIALPLAVVATIALSAIPALAGSGERVHHSSQQQGHEGGKKGGKKKDGKKGGKKKDGKRKDGKRKNRGDKRKKDKGRNAGAAATIPGPALQFGAVTVTSDGPGRRLVAIETEGAPMSAVTVCDLAENECVQATLDSGTWIASLPAPDPVRYSIGLIGRSGGTFVTGNARSNPPAPIPPLVNIG